MKILIVSSKVPFPLYDGGAIATYRVMSGYEQQGHDISILAVSTDKHKVSLDSIPTKLRARFDWHIIEISAQIGYRGALWNLFFSAKPYNVARFLNFDFALYLQKMIAENNFDIIQVEGLLMSSYFELIRHKSNAKLIYRAHNIEADLWRQRYKSCWSLKRLYLWHHWRRITKFEIDRVDLWDALLTISPHDECYFRNIYKSKKPILNLPTGIDTVKLSKPKGKFKSIFHIGALDWQPNIEGLFWFLDNCWEGLRLIHTDLEFHIAGRNGNEKLLKQLEVYNGIKVHGEVRDATKFISEHGIMIVPIQTGGGMKIKLIDGFQNGCSIVSTIEGTKGLDLEDGNQLLIANGAEEFVEKVSSLLNDEHQAKKLGLSGQKWAVENLSNTDLAKKALHFLSDL